MRPPHAGWGTGHGLRSDGSVREEDEEEEEEEEAVQVRQSLCWGGQADEGKHAAQPFPRESKGSLWDLLR